MRKLLIAHPHLRDDDDKLIANIWHNDANLGFRVNMLATDLLRMMAEGRLTNVESIRRSRQQIQQEEPGLRGKSYKLRKLEATETVKKELGYES